MKFSIIIPSMNQAAYLEQTLQSVLSQDHPDREILVFDGGSTDGSVEILKGHQSPDLQWISRPDRGQAAAINQGLWASSGEILAYLNSDDFYYPGALKIVDSYFAAHPECEILYGDAHHLFEATDTLEPYYTEDWDYDRLLDVCYLCQPAVFWRRSVMERHGVLDDSLHGAMDYDYWLRIGKTIPFHRLRGSFLAVSRMYATNKTLQNRIRIHEEILAVALRHASRPPYRWLKVLAHIQVEESLASEPPNRRTFVYAYVKRLLKLAREYEFYLDDKTLSELENDLNSVE